jgi:lysophospholipase L1-like esterase
MKVVRNHTLLWAGFFLLLGLGLNEVVISRLKGANLSNLTLLTLRGFNIYFAAIGLLLFAYSQREDWRAQIKQTLFRLFTISLPVLIIGALELGIKTWERLYVETYSSPEDMSAEQTIFRLSLDGTLYGQNASPQGVSPYRPQQSDHYNINGYGLRIDKMGAVVDRGDKWTIGMLGGSTVWGYNLADGHTLPAVLKDAFTAADRDGVAVLNLGISGIGFAGELNVIRHFVDAQLIKPDHLIFYHGGNDFAQVYQYVMKGHRDENILYADPGYLQGLDRHLSQSSLFSWMKFAVAQVLPNTYYADVAEETEHHPARIGESARDYLTNYVEAMEFCRDSNTTCDFFIQPLLTNKASKTLTERIAVNAHLNRFPKYMEYYDEYVDRILAAKKQNIYDLRGVLQTGDLVFSHKDIIHVNARGNVLIADAIHRQLITNGNVKAQIGSVIERTETDSL